MEIENLILNANSFPIGKCGLGDLISIFYSLENLGRQNGILFKINPIDIDVCFYKYFEFKNLKIENNNFGKDIIKETRILKSHSCRKNLGFFDGSIFISCFLDFLKKKYKYNPLYSKPIFYKEKKQSEEVAVQFDSRSAIRKRTISIDKIYRTLKGEKDYFCLGGLETKKYLGENTRYCLGDIDFILCKLINCKKFIGSDSGVSHLAGSIGLYSQIHIKDYCGCIQNYYSESYRNCFVFNSIKRFY